MKLSSRYDAPNAVSLSPHHAVVFYSSGSYHGATVATLHDIETSTGQMRMSTGRLLSHQALRDELESIAAPAAPLYPSERCVGIFRDTMAWWVPAAKRALFWETGEDTLNRFNRVPLACPPLVLVKRGQTDLRVFALRENSRPLPTTPLFFAPFYNLDQNGKMCTGTLRDATRKEQEICAFWERFFFQSAFTHPGGGRLARNGSYIKLVETMAKAETFPSKQLVPHSLSLEESLICL